MADYRLIITEKPSVARDIGRVLGISRRRGGYLDGGDTRITWCVGHLLELASPTTYNPAWKQWRLETLPMMPERFNLQPRDSARDQFAVVKAQLAGAATVINACDAGREGELIFSWVYEFSRCKAPIQRLWISSMTDAAIRRGFDALRDGEALVPLQSAARCRAEADWLVGLNATRAMTTRFSRGPERVLLSVGRVQTPTLALLARREQEIEDFVAEPFWEVKAKLSAEKGTWDAVWTRPGAGRGGKKGDSATRFKDTRLKDKAQAEAIVARLKDAEGTMARVERKKSREKPPLLYDLTNLQKEANRRFKYTAKRTLEIAQALYETHKVLTYPRTDSRHLGTDQVPLLPDMVRGIGFGPYHKASDDILQRWPIKLSKRVVDDAEVSDHHAIIPTGQDPRRRSLSVDEKRVFDLVARRTLAAMMPDAVFAVAQMDAVFGAVDEHGEPRKDGGDRLVARGRTCLEPGWRAIDPPVSKRKEVLLPPIDKGDDVRVDKVRLHEGTTKPPRRYTEATLLAAMEGAGDSLEDAELKRAMKRNGLGTPATRAAIIETLLTRGYVAREKANIIATPHGRALLNALPVQGLSSPQLTGAWEARLVAMAEGNDDRQAFMADIRSYTEEIIAGIRAVTDEQVKGAGFKAPPPTGDVLGKCRSCKEDVRAARYGWSCTACELHIPGRIAGRDISERMAKTLLSKGETKAVKGFRSKAGKDFSAALRFDDTWRVRFTFPEPDALGDCPACGKPVRPRGSIYTCDTGRDCAFVVFGEMSGHKVKTAEVKALLQDGRTSLIKGMKARDESKFDGILAWSDGRVRAIRVDARELLEPAGKCPDCGGAVGFSRGRWRCGGCRFGLPGMFMQRPLGRDDVATLLHKGRTWRLHGFRQQGGGKAFKAALVLGRGGRLELDYSADGGDAPIPKSGPRPAFGERVDCACCVEAGELDPGYVIAGRAAWGCSRWRQGCKLQVPFVIVDHRLSDDEARRLLGKHRATRYEKHFTADGKGTSRVALVPGSKPCWRIEKRGGKKR